jgi:hypothetical protein
MATFSFWRTPFFLTGGDNPDTGEIHPENAFLPGRDDDNLEPLDITEGIGDLAAGRLNDPLVETPSSALHHMEMGRFAFVARSSRNFPMVFFSHVINDDLSFVAIHLLPEDIKANYLTAKRQVPELVASETAPLRFLVREEFDPWAAARRLCCYWTFRKQSFADRWLRPMDLSGEGCLTKADVSVLQSGAMVFSTAENGIQTMIFNMTKVLKYGADLGRRSRCAVYFGTMCATDVSRRRGYDVMFLATSAGMRPSPMNGSLIVKGRTSSMCKLREVYVVRDPTDRKPILARYCTALVCKILENVCGIRPHIIMEENVESIAAKLVELGMDRGCIPQDIAGGHNGDHFQSMIDARIQMDIYKHAFLESGVAMQESPRVGEISLEDGLFDASVFQDMDLDVYSQVGFAAAPIISTPVPAVARAVPSMDHSARWGEHSTAAVEAYRTDLILRACTELDQGERSERNDKFFRKRNALYSRRNYQRRKENEGKLQTEHSDLRDANKALKGEHARLLALLEQAEAVVEEYNTPND